MATHEVTLAFEDGPTRTIAVGENETVVEATESAEFGIPYGCLTGACGTCTGRLVEGADAVEDAFEYRRPPRGLKDRHHEDGYVLLCVATPRTDCRVAVGSSVQAELVENPWK